MALEMLFRGKNVTIIGTQKNPIHFYDISSGWQVHSQIYNHC